MASNSEVSNDSKDLRESDHTSVAIEMDCEVAECFDSEITLVSVEIKSDTSESFPGGLNSDKTVDTIETETVNDRKNSALEHLFAHGNKGTEEEGVDELQEQGTNIINVVVHKETSNDELGRVNSENRIGKCDISESGNVGNTTGVGDGEVNVEFEKEDRGGFETRDGEVGMATDSEQEACGYVGSEIEYCDIYEDQDNVHVDSCAENNVDHREAVDSRMEIDDFSVSVEPTCVTIDNDGALCDEGVSDVGELIDESETYFGASDRTCEVDVGDGHLENKNTDAINTGTFCENGRKLARGSKDMETEMCVQGYKETGEKAVSSADIEVKETSDESQNGIGNKEDAENSGSSGCLVKKWHVWENSLFNEFMTTGGVFKEKSDVEKNFNANDGASMSVQQMADENLTINDVCHSKEKEKVEEGFSCTNSSELGEDVSVNAKSVKKDELVTPSRTNEQSETVEEPSNGSDKTASINQFLQKLIMQRTITRKMCTKLADILTQTKGVVGCGLLGFVNNIKTVLTYNVLVIETVVKQCQDGSCDVETYYGSGFIWRITRDVVRILAKAEKMYIKHTLWLDVMRDALALVLWTMKNISEGGLLVLFPEKEGTEESQIGDPVVSPNSKRERLFVRLCGVPLLVVNDMGVKLTETEYFLEKIKELKSWYLQIHNKNEEVINIVKIAIEAISYAQRVWDLVVSEETKFADQKNKKTRQRKPRNPVDNLMVSVPELSDFEPFFQVFEPSTSSVDTEDEFGNESLLEASTRQTSVKDDESRQINQLVKCLKQFMSQNWSNLLPELNKFPTNIPPNCDEGKFYVDIQKNTSTSAQATVNFSDVWASQLCLHDAFTTWETCKPTLGPLRLLMLVYDAQIEMVLTQLKAGETLAELKRTPCEQDVRRFTALQALKLCCCGQIKELFSDLTLLLEVLLKNYDKCNYFTLCIMDLGPILERIGDVSRKHLACMHTIAKATIYQRGLAFKDFNSFDLFSKKSTDVCITETKKATISILSNVQQASTWIREWNQFIGVDPMQAKIIAPDIAFCTKVAEPDNCVSNNQAEKPCGMPTARKRQNHFVPTDSELKRCKTTSEESHLEKSIEKQCPLSLTPSNKLCQNSSGSASNKCIISILEANPLKIIEVVDDGNQKEGALRYGNTPDVSLEAEARSLRQVRGKTDEIIGKHATQSTNEELLVANQSGKVTTSLSSREPHVQSSSTENCRGECLNTAESSSNQHCVKFTPDLTVGKENTSKGQIGLQRKRKVQWSEIVPFTTFTQLARHITKLSSFMPDHLYKVGEIYVQVIDLTKDITPLAQFEHSYAQKKADVIVGLLLFSVKPGGETGGSICTTGKAKVHYLGLYLFPKVKMKFADEFDRLEMSIARIIGKPIDAETAPVNVNHNGTTKEVGTMTCDEEEIQSMTINADVFQSMTIDTDVIPSITIDADKFQSMTIDADKFQSMTIDADVLLSMTSDADGNQSMTIDEDVNHSLSNNAEVTLSMTRDSDTISPLFKNAAMIQPMTSGADVNQPMTSDAKGISSVTSDASRNLSMTKNSDVFQSMTGDSDTISPLHVIKDTDVIQSVTNDTDEMQSMTSDADTISSTGDKNLATVDALHVVPIEAKKRILVDNPSESKQLAHCAPSVSTAPESTLSLERQKDDLKEHEGVHGDLEIYSDVCTEDMQKQCMDTSKENHIARDLDGFKNSEKEQMLFEKSIMDFAREAIQKSFENDVQKEKRLNPCPTPVPMVSTERQKFHEIGFNYDCSYSKQKEVKYISVPPSHQKVNNVKATHNAGSSKSWRDVKSYETFRKLVEENSILFDENTMLGQDVSFDTELAMAGYRVQFKAAYREEMDWLIVFEGLWIKVQDLKDDILEAFDSLKDIHAGMQFVFDCFAKLVSVISNIFKRWEDVKQLFVEIPTGAVLEKATISNTLKEHGRKILCDLLYLLNVDKRQTQKKCSFDVRLLPFCNKVVSLTETIAEEYARIWVTGHASAASITPSTYTVPVIVYELNATKEGMRFMGNFTIAKSFCDKMSVQSIRRRTLPTTMQPKSVIKWPLGSLNEISSCTLAMRRSLLSPCSLFVAGNTVAAAVNFGTFGDMNLGGNSCSIDPVIAILYFRKFMEQGEGFINFLGMTLLCGPDLRKVTVIWRYDQIQDLLSLISSVKLSDETSTGVQVVNNIPDNAKSSTITASSSRVIEDNEQNTKCESLSTSSNAAKSLLKRKILKGKTPSILQKARSTSESVKSQQLASGKCVPSHISTSEPMNTMLGPAGTQNQHLRSESTKTVLKPTTITQVSGTSCHTTSQLTKVLFSDPVKLEQDTIESSSSKHSNVVLSSHVAQNIESCMLPSSLPIQVQGSNMQIPLMFNPLVSQVQGPSTQIPVMLNPLVSQVQGPSTQIPVVLYPLVSQVQGSSTQIPVMLNPLVSQVQGSSTQIPVVLNPLVSQVQGSSRQTDFMFSHAVADHITRPVTTSVLSPQLATLNQFGNSLHSSVPGLHLLNQQSAHKTAMTSVDSCVTAPVIANPKVPVNHATSTVTKASSTQSRFQKLAAKYTPIRPVPTPVVSEQAGIPCQGQGSQATLAPPSTELNPTPALLQPSDKSMPNLALREPVVTCETVDETLSVNAPARTKLAPYVIQIKFSLDQVGIPSNSPASTSTVNNLSLPWNAGLSPVISSVSKPGEFHFVDVNNMFVGPGLTSTSVSTIETLSTSSSVDRSQRQKTQLVTELGADSKQNVLAPITIKPCKNSVPVEKNKQVLEMPSSKNITKQLAQGTVNRRPDDSSGHSTGQSETSVLLAALSSKTPGRFETQPTLAESNMQSVSSANQNMPLLKDPLTNSSNGKPIALKKNPSQQVAFVLSATGQEVILERSDEHAETSVKSALRTELNSLCSAAKKRTQASADIKVSSKSLNYEKHKKSRKFVQLWKIYNEKAYTLEEKYAFISEFMITTIPSVENWVDSPGSTEENWSYTCLLCRKRLRTNLERLFLHSLNHLYCCRVCSKQFSWSGNFSAHFVTRHMVNGQLATPDLHLFLDDAFRGCHWCGEKGVQHRIWKADDNGSRCRDCVFLCSAVRNSSQTDDSDARTRHKLYHLFADLDAPFLCGGCNQLFWLKATLALHLFKNSVCGNKYLDEKQSVDVFEKLVCKLLAKENEVVNRLKELQAEIYKRARLKLSEQTQESCVETEGACEVAVGRGPVLKDEVTETGDSCSGESTGTLDEGSVLETM